MVLDLKQLFGNSVGARKLDAEFDLSDLEFSGVFPIKTPVKITGEILSKTGIVSLSAKISLDYEAPCDRCGTPAAWHYDFKVEKTLVTELANAEEIDDILVIPDMKLDLEEFTVTEVVLSLPTKHLCREDCKGVCQSCGKNLNLGDCDCVKEPVNPGLQALRALLDDAESTNQAPKN